MKKKVKLSLITSFAVFLLLTATVVHSFAYSVCKTSTKPFQRNYNEDIGCSYVNVPIALNTSSASTHISAPSGCGLQTYVAAWRSNGTLIDNAIHNGTHGNSTASIIWIVAVPTHTQHDGIITSGTVGSCKGYHTRQYQ